MSKEPNLDFYRRRAKELLKLAQSGDSDARARVKRHHPDYKRSIHFDELALNHTQYVIARENGFSSWTRLKGYVETMDRSRAQNSPEQLQHIIRTRDLEALDDFIRTAPKAVEMRIEPLGTTGLHEAAGQNWQDGVELLIEAGADINAIATQNSVTPLQQAIGFGSATVARWLLEHGADPTIENVPDKSTMRIAAGADDRAMIRALLDRGFQADIFAAIALRDENLIRKLVIVDASVLKERLRLHEVVTLFPLHVAASHDAARIIDLLVYLGAELTAVDEQNRTAIDLALNMGKRQAYDQLIALGCRPSPSLLEMVGTPDRAVRIARLHGALVSGNQKAVAEEIDADPSLINQRLPDVWGSGGTFGGSPLHWAAMFGHVELAKFLLERGADLELKDLTYDAAPIGWAKEYRRREMIAFLKAQGADES